MNDEAKEKYEWLMNAMKTVDLKPTPFAKAAGISPSTLTRFLKNPETATPPQDKTLDHIARNLGIPSLRGGPQTPLMPGFSEDGALRLTPSEIGDSKHYKTLIETINNQVENNNLDRFWVMNGRALENRAILHNDWLLVDYDLEPEPDDIVCISLRDEENFRAKTIFRAMIAKDPVPVCMTATNDTSIEPKAIFVDGIRAKIYGVVTMTFRKNRG